MEGDQGSAEPLVDAERLMLRHLIPTLPMFVTFPMRLPRNGFWSTLLVGIAITAP